MTSKQRASNPNASIDRMVKEIFSSSYIGEDGKRYVDEAKYREAKKQMPAPVKKQFKLKNVKTFKGMENDQLDADLYCDGKYMATFFDDGWGGGYQIEWASPEAEKIVTDYCAAQPAYVSKDLIDAGKPFTCDYSVEFLVDDLFNAYQEEKEAKRLQRRAKTQVLFRLKGDAEGEWRVCGKNLLTPEKHQAARDAMTRKYGDKIERFYA